MIIITCIFAILGAFSFGADSVCSVVLSALPYIPYSLSGAVKLVDCERTRRPLVKKCSTLFKTTIILGSFDAT